MMMGELPGQKGRLGKWGGVGRLAMIGYATPAGRKIKGATTG
jgi:hypothetical protein